MNINQIVACCGWKIYEKYCIIISMVVRMPFILCHMRGEKMNIFFNTDELLRVITNLYTLTGIRANIMDADGTDICLDDWHLPFCTAINSTPEGHQRCLDCDAAAVKQCHKSGQVRYYRCHAGICEAMVPICSGGQVLAYLAFGQFLDTTPVDEQWKNTLATLDWYKGDMEEIHEKFLQFGQHSKEQMEAFADILKAMATYIMVEGMIHSTTRSELQLLESFLEQHYMEKLSLSSISRQLNIGRTKLCALAKELSGGKTLTHLIAERRVQAAKRLLDQTNLPVSQIAESVGISDYNYFSKIFRSIAGTTPSAYRKSKRSLSRKPQ